MWVLYEKYAYYTFIERSEVAVRKCHHAVSRHTRRHNLRPQVSDMQRLFSLMMQIREGMESSSFRAGCEYKLGKKLSIRQTTR